MEKEELKERIKISLERLGKYHIFLLFGFGLSNIVTGISHGVTLFHTYTPEYYCNPQNTDPSTNETDWNVCHEDSTCYFDPKDEYDSLVTDFGLICSRRYLSPLINTIYFVGVTSGAVIFGPLSDKFGRKPIIIYCTIGHLLMGILIYFKLVTVSIEVFIVLRFVQGMVIQAVQTAANTAAVELSPVRIRTAVGTIWEICFATGGIYLGSIAKFVFEWRILQLYILIPTILSLLFMVFLAPESMYWLWTKNHFTKSIKIYSTIAKRNNDQEFLKDEPNFQKDKNWTEIENKIRQSGETEKSRSAILVILDLFKNPILRKHIIIMGYYWLACTLSYYGLYFFLPSLSGDRFINVIIGSVTEIAALFLMYFAMKKFGRRSIMIGMTVINAAICIVFAGLTLINEETSSIEYSKIVLLLVGKAIAASAFGGMIIYTQELFPTVCRGSMMGYCGFWARIGSLVAPQFISLGEIVDKWLPMSLLGLGLIASAIPLFLLPETFKIQIPNTFDDVQRLWGSNPDSEEECDEKKS